MGRSQDEMLCWSTNKAISLLIVLCGIASYTRGMMMYGDDDVAVVETNDEEEAGY